MSFIEPDAPETTIGPEPVGPAPTPPDLPPAAETDQEPDTFPRDYVEELRKENAQWRTKLREQEAIFDGYEPEEREALATFLRLSRAAERGDQDAAQQLQDLFGGDDDDEGLPPATESDGPQYLTREEAAQLAREQAEALLAERDQQRAQQDAIASVRTQAEALGYQHGTDDYVLLMKAANDLDPAEHQDLIAAADEKVKAYKQAIIDSYLNEKEQRAEGSPTIPSGNGVAPSIGSDTYIHDPNLSEAEKFAIARQRTRERLENARG